MNNEKFFRYLCTHVGEMICNKEIADCVARILRQLFDAKYPIHS
jgi:hypothetical protein